MASTDAPHAAAAAARPTSRALPRHRPAHDGTDARSHPGGHDDRGAGADQSECGEGADERPRADADDRGHCGVMAGSTRPPYASTACGRRSGRRPAMGVTNTLRSRPIAEMSYPLVAQYSSTRCVGERVVAVEADSWDVYFPAPLSLSLVANTFAHNGMQRELGTLLDLHDGQVDAIAADLRLFAPDRRLDVTAMPTTRCRAGPRCTSTCTSTCPAHRSTRAPTSGSRSPARSSRPPPPGRGSATRRGCARRPPRRWASAGIPCPRTRPRGDEVRVVGLPRALHVTGGGAGVCYGYFGPHEQIMAADDGVTTGVQPASG